MTRWMIRALVISAFVIVFHGNSAQAQVWSGGSEQEYATTSDACEGTMDMETCLWSPMGATTSGTFYQCSAKGTWGGKCADVTETGGRRTCSRVAYSAYCQCDSTTFVTTGVCGYRP